MRFILSLLLLSTLGVFAACQDAAAPTSVSPLPSDSARKATTPIVPTQKENHEEHSDEAPRISLADAKKDFDAGSAVFIDTRAETGFKTGHIKGAINIPMESFAVRYKEVPKDKKIIAYCS